MATRTIRLRASKVSGHFVPQDMDIKAERIGFTDRWHWAAAGSSQWWGSFETEEAAFAGAAAHLGGELLS